MTILAASSRCQQLVYLSSVNTVLVCQVKPELNLDPALRLSTVAGGPVYQNRLQTKGNSQELRGLGRYLLTFTRFK